MDFNLINMIGEIYIEEVNSLPAWDSSYQRRLLFNKNDNYFYYGSSVGWKKFSKAEDLDTHKNSTSNPHSTTYSQVGAPSESNFNSHVSDFDSHKNNTSNPHGVTSDQANAPSQSEFDSHKNNTSDPHDTLTNFDTPGYVIYYKNTTQQYSGSYGPLNFDVNIDSYNNNKVTEDGDLDRFTLEKGLYRISYRVIVYEADSGTTPPARVKIYNVTTSSYLDYTYTNCELDDSVQHNTLSFSFPIYLNQETNIELHFQSSSSQLARVNEATLAIEIIMADVS